MADLEPTRASGFQWANRRGAALAVAVMAALVALPGTSSAIDLRIGRGGDSLPRLNDQIDPYAAENRRLRQDFQRDQQRFRQEDRERATRLPREDHVPVLRQKTCRTQMSGNSYITTCR
jgi:hypothetical protein